MNLRKIWAFIQLTRPLFLMGGVLLIAVGTLAALLDGARFNLLRMMSGQALVTCIQLMTHYVNEYYDLESDRLNTNRTWFSGGSGMLSNGTLSPRVARSAAVVFSLLAGLALAAAGFQVPAVLLIGLPAWAAAWSYSAPPLRLVTTGLGELSASVVVAGMVPLVGYMMQSGGRLSPNILVACLPLALIHYAMLIAFQIPDGPADQAGGKRTIYVRLGPALTTWLHNTSLLVAFCVILVLSFMGWPGAQIAWLALPLAVWQMLSFRGYTRKSRPPFLGLTMRALALFAFTTILWLAGLALLWTRT